MSEASKVVCIVGPTASGKSSLAESVALRLKSAVVSIDAMQVYRGMDVDREDPTGGEALPASDGRRLRPHRELFRPALSG